MQFCPVQPIETPRLKLVPCDIHILEAILEGREILSHALGTDVPDHWTGFGSAPFRYVLEKFRSDRGEVGWWTFLPIRKEGNVLIGSGGYKGPPDEKGVVEIGYEITTAHRGQGLATEMAQGLVRHAFGDPRVKQVIAHTMGKENASTSVLLKCGFEKIGEIALGEEWLAWKWVISRSDP